MQWLDVLSLVLKTLPPILKQVVTSGGVGVKRSG